MTTAYNGAEIMKELEIPQEIIDIISPDAETERALVHFGVAIEYWWVDRYLKHIGVDYNVHYVGLDSEKGKDHEGKSYTWEYTRHKATFTKGVKKLESDYRMGIGHLKISHSDSSKRKARSEFYKNQFGESFRDRIFYTDHLTSQKLSNVLPAGLQRHWDSCVWLREGIKPIANVTEFIIPGASAFKLAVWHRLPLAADVLYSVLSDANAGDMGHEEFCDNYGYDPDSIKAKKIWEECTNVHYKLRGFFTPEQRGILEKLLEQF